MSKEGFKKEKRTSDSRKKKYRFVEQKVSSNGNSNGSREPSPSLSASTDLREQQSVEVAVAKDPGNLGNTLSEPTRRRLFESQRNVRTIDAREAGQRPASIRLSPSQVDVDMEAIFPKDE